MKSTSFSLARVRAALARSGSNFLHCCPSTCSPTPSSSELSHRSSTMSCVGKVRSEVPCEYFCLTGQPRTHQQGRLTPFIFILKAVCNHLKDTGELQFCKCATLKEVDNLLMSLAKYSMKEPENDPQPVKTIQSF